MKDSTDPRFLANKSLRNYLIPPIASKELRKIVVSFGAAIDQIPVTKAVVIKTTSTQPGTSPRLFLVIALVKEDLIERIRLIGCIFVFIILQIICFLKYKSKQITKTKTQAYCGKTKVVIKLLLSVN
jgi:hypothetical protein